MLAELENVSQNISTVSFSKDDIYDSYLSDIITLERNAQDLKDQIEELNSEMGSFLAKRLSRTAAEKAITKYKKDLMNGISEDVLLTVDKETTKILTSFKNCASKDEMKEYIGLASEVQKKIVTVKSWEETRNELQRVSDMISNEANNVARSDILTLIDEMVGKLVTIDAYNAGMTAVENMLKEKITQDELAKAIQTAKANSNENAAKNLVTKQKWSEILQSAQAVRDKFHGAKFTTKDVIEQLGRVISE